MTKKGGSHEILIALGGAILAVIVVFSFFRYRSYDPAPQLLPIDEVKQVAVIPHVGDVTDVSSETSTTEVSDLDDTLPATFEELRETVEASEQLEELSAAPVEPVAVKTIEVTDGIRHSVPLSEILGGGPPKDGIPSIDSPLFVSVSDAQTFLDDGEPGIAVSIDGINRFYPFQILVWHEIVNDTYNDKRVLVTYCPLCLSGIVFDPVVQGERVEFGTSGKLWQSNLVMYDRKTDTYWSQVLGEAIRGELTGAMLEVLPSDQMRFGEWRAQFPGGNVLSKETGIARVYGLDPYGSYYTDNDSLIGRISNEDDRLDRKEFVLGVVINGQAKAYHTDAVKRDGTVRDVVAGETIIAEYDQTLDVVRIYQEGDEGVRTRINPFANFWFSWAAVHPDTQLYK